MKERDAIQYEKVHRYLYLVRLPMSWKNDSNKMD